MRSLSASRMPSLFGPHWWPRVRRQVDPPDPRIAVGRGLTTSADSSVQPSPMTRCSKSPKVWARTLAMQNGSTVAQL